MKKEAIVEFYSSKNREEYIKFLLNRSDSDIYHTLEWKEIIEDLFNVESNYIIARDKKGNIRSVLPLFFINNLCGKRLDSIPLSMYGGVIGDEYYIKLLIKKAIELKLRKKCNNLVIRQLIQGYENIFKEFNMGTSVRCYRQYVQIKNPYIMWKYIKKSNRNSIRKAIKNNIKIEKISNRKYIADFHRLALITNKHVGLPIPSLAFFNRIWDVMHPKGYGEIFIARYKEKIIASTLIFPFNNKVTCGYINSDMIHLNLRPINLLIWKILEWCFKNNFNMFDFGTTPLRNKGLYFFKSTFNTSEILISYYFYPKNTIILNDTLIGIFGKRILKIIPIFLAKRINSLLIKSFG